MKYPISNPYSFVIVIEISVHVSTVSKKKIRRKKKNKHSPLLSRIFVNSIPCETAISEYRSGQLFLFSEISYC